MNFLKTEAIGAHAVKHDHDWPTKTITQLESMLEILVA